EVRRVRGTDGVRCQALQDARLVEQLEAADDGEDRGDDQGPAQGRDLDGPDHLDLVGAVHLCRLVEGVRHHTQGRVEDQHVVTHELPGHDVADGGKDQAGGEGVG